VPNPLRLPVNSSSRAGLRPKRSQAYRGSRTGLLTLYSVSLGHQIVRDLLQSVGRSAGKFHLRSRIWEAR